MGFGVAQLSRRSSSSDTYKRWLHSDETPCVHFVSGLHEGRLNSYPLCRIGSANVTQTRLGVPVAHQRHNGSDAVTIRTQPRAEGGPEFVPPQPNNPGVFASCCERVLDVVVGSSCQWIRENKVVHSLSATSFP